MAYKTVSATYKYPKLPDPRGIRPATGEEARPGDVIAEGTYRGRNNTPSKFGKRSILVAESNGQVVSLNPSGQLERALEAGGVRVGDQIRITYSGLQVIQKGDFKGQKAHQFKLEVDEERRVAENNLAELPAEDMEDDVLPEALHEEEVVAAAPRRISNVSSMEESSSRKESNADLLTRYRNKV